MSIIGTGIPFNDATINSAFAPEARVIASGTASGDTFLTVDAALAAGARSIWVESGTHAGFTVTSSMSGTRIVGARASYLGNSNGANFSSVIIVQTPYSKLENLTSYQSSGYGFRIDSGCSFLQLVRCFARESSSHGFVFNYGGGADTLDMTFYSCVAYDCTGDGFALNDSDATSAVEANIINCWSFSNSKGLSVASSSTYAATNHRTVSVIGGTFRSNSSYGIHVGDYATAIIAGTHTHGNNGGIYIATPSNTTARSVITGNRIRSNGPYGIQMQATTALIGVTGNTVYGHSSANLLNCSSCPGYSTNVGT